MDFGLSAEQELLKSSVERMTAERYDFESRKLHGRSPGGWSRAMWAQYAELGLLGLPFDEADGGFGGGPIETMVVIEAFGRALVLEPYLATVVLGGGLLRRGAGAELRAELVPAIAAGDLRLAFAQAERQSRYDLHDVSTTARREDGGGYRIEGAKSLVLHGDTADKLLVTARVAGGRRERDGIGLFLVDADAPGVTRRGYPTQDGQRAAEISFASVSLGPEHVIGDPEMALPLVERVVDEALAALCAEAVGAMQEMHVLTIDYLKTRRQFGVPIGSFQALQHRAADMFVTLEQARSMAMLATVMAHAEDPAERRKAVSAAKFHIGRSARAIRQEAVQLHGGIGLTMEYKVGHLFKRATAIGLQFGDADHHLTLLAAAGDLLAS